MRRALGTTSFALLAVLAAGCVKAKTLGDRPRPGSEEDALAPADGPPADVASRPDAPGLAADLGDGRAPWDAPAEAPPATCSPACAAGSECREGACVCSPPSCDEGQFFVTDGGGFHLAAASNFLVFEGGPSGLMKLNLATKQAVPLPGVKEPGTVWGLAVDAQDRTYWCHDDQGPTASTRWSLMRNDTVLETRYCRSGLRVTDTHLYVADTVSLFRRPLDRPGLEILLDAPTFESIEVDETHTYYGTNELDTTQLRRVRHDAPGHPEKLFETQGFDVFTLALDRQHVYFAGRTLLRRLPLAGGPVEDLWYHEASRSIRLLALSSTHLYWATSTADTCQELRVFRRGKLGGVTQMLASLPERCPRALVLHGDRLYLATSVPFGGEKNAIYRIRP